MQGYNKVIDEVNADLSTFKGLIEKNDIAGLDEIKSRLTANKAHLGQLLLDYTSLYKDAKRKLLINKCGYYKRFRETMSQSDAEVESKIETIKELEEVDNMFIRKEKCRVLAEDVNDVIITIASTIKRLNTESTYG